MTSSKVNVVLALLLISILSACAYSVERLMHDDKLRHKVLKDCVAKGTDAVESTNCKNAAEAQAKVTGKAIKNLFD